ncbi:hypothetical protein Barb6XT_02208 [Bacteroidales bacterium Barb6XT]|nr:hypothetical protein Barb6XT_02208 [Bacteroidales bacterium Barb6XT]
MFKIKRVKNTKTGDVFSVPVGDNSMGIYDSQNYCVTG